MRALTQDEYNVLLCNMRDVRVETGTDYGSRLLAINEDLAERWCMVRIDEGGGDIMFVRTQLGNLALRVSRPGYGVA